MLPHAAPLGTGRRRHRPAQHTNTDLSQQREVHVLLVKEHDACSPCGQRLGAGHGGIAVDLRGGGGWKQGECAGAGGRGGATTHTVVPAAPTSCSGRGPEGLRPPNGQPLALAISSELFSEL